MPENVDSYYLGKWLIEPQLQRISYKTEIRKVEPQLMAVLQLLVSRSGQVVTKEDLQNTVWAGVIVTENVLTRAISSLRKLLDDDPKKPIFIETISKSGYRLLINAKPGPESKKNDAESFTIKLSKKPVVVVSTIVLLVVLGAFATRSIFLPLSSAKVYSPMPIANFSNTEYWPAISPDGRFVAYGWKGTSDDNWDIYAKLIGTETTLRITDNPATDLRAVWSSSGNYIYYLRYEAGGSTIYKKAVTGGEELRVLSSPIYSSGNFDVSPDEKWIAFNTRKSPNDPLQVTLISLESGESRLITNPEKGNNGDLHPTFSNDGRKIAFIRERNSVAMYLWIYDMKSERVEQITFDHHSINGFDWLDNNSSLVYGTDKSGLYKLWEVNLNNKNVSLLKAGDYQMVMPRVGEGKIIYAKMKDNVNLWTYDIERKIAKSWRATNDLALNGVVSNAGDKVCFSSTKDGVFQIWVANVDGTNAVPITNFIGEYVTNPVWSRNDDEIVFQGFEEGQSDIYMVDSRGGVPENLTNSSEDEHRPFIDADGDIYFSTNRDQTWSIWKMAASGQRKREVMTGNVYGAQLDQEGNFYFVKRDQMGLWKYSPENKSEELIVQHFHPMNPGAYTVMDGGLYYYNAMNRSFEYLNFDSNEVSFVYKPKGRIPRMGITLRAYPDSKNLLFAQIDQNDADIMLLKEQ